MALLENNAAKRCAQSRAQFSRKSKSARQRRGVQRQRKSGAASRQQAATAATLVSAAA